MSATAKYKMKEFRSLFGDKITMWQSRGLSEFIADVFVKFFDSGIHGKLEAEEEFNRAEVIFNAGLNLQKTQIVHSRVQPLNCKYTAKDSSQTTTKGVQLYKIPGYVGPGSLGQRGYVDPNSLGQRYRIALAISGKKAVQLAGELGVSPTLLSHVANGTRPSAKVREKLESWIRSQMDSQNAKGDQNG